jgi:hypothetical protein
MEFELRALHLCYTSSPFCFSYFSCRVSLFCPKSQSQTMVLLLMTLAEMTDRCHHVHLVGWDGVLLIFCPGWLKLQSSWSLFFQVARITGVSHHVWLSLPFNSFLGSELPDIPIFPTRKWKSESELQSEIWFWDADNPNREEHLCKLHRPTSLSQNRNTSVAADSGLDWGKSECCDEARCVI